MAAKLNAGRFSPAGLDLDFAPFSETDFEALSHSVREVQIGSARFAKLIAEMNNAARTWKLRCDLALAPTDLQERAYVKSIQGAAARLANLLNVSFEEDCPEKMSQPAERAEPIAVAFDEEWVRTAETRGSMPEGFPEDPTAAGAWSIPLALDRMLMHFDRYYRVDAGEQRTLALPEEALHELSLLAQALDSGARDRLAELDVAEPDIAPPPPIDCGHRADEPVTFDDARSPNHGLFLDLVDVYEEMFATELRRSRTSPKRFKVTEPSNQPSGPALNFFRFVFDRLEVRKGRSDETIIDWVEDCMASRRA